MESSWHKESRAAYSGYFINDRHVDFLRRIRDRGGL